MGGAKAALNQVLTVKRDTENTYSILGVKKCSCLEELGPIQIAVPCKWITTEEPICSSAKHKPRRRMKNKVKQLQNDFVPPVRVLTRL